MKITLTLLQKWNACDEGLAWFDLTFPEGVNLDALVHRLAHPLNTEYREDWLAWLIGHAEGVSDRWRVECIEGSRNPYDISGRVLDQIPHMREGFVDLLMVWGTLGSKPPDWEEYLDRAPRLTVPDSLIEHEWVGCCNGPAVVVGPGFYENAGTPVCDECGRDLTYVRTRIAPAHAARKGLMVVDRVDVDELDRHRLTLGELTVILGRLGAILPEGATQRHLDALEGVVNMLDAWSDSLVDELGKERS